MEGFESVRRSPRRTESRAFARKPCPLSHAARRRIHDHTGKKKFSIIPDFNLIDKVKAARPQIMKKPGSGMASSGFNPLNRFCPGASDQPFQLSVVNTRSNKSGTVTGPSRKNTHLQWLSNKISKFFFLCAASAKSYNSIRMK